MGKSFSLEIYCPKHNNRARCVICNKQFSLEEFGVLLRWGGNNEPKFHILCLEVMIPRLVKQLEKYKSLDN